MQWKAHFFLHVQGKLTDAILRLIERERKGETVDQDLVKKVVDSFLLLGLDEKDINKVSFDVYKEHLEKPFLEATGKYYEQERESFLAEGSLSDYLKRAEERLKEEEDRVDRYLRTETREHLVRMLIRHHFRLIWESYPSLHDFDRDEDLRKMHTFLSRTPEDLEPLAKKFEEHVRKTGLATVAKLLGEQSDGVNSLDPKAYVDTLLEVHRTNSEIVTRTFSGVASLVASLDKACKEVVNHNDATGSSTTKSPELLVRHVDMLLRGNNQMAEEDLELHLNRAVLHTSMFDRALTTDLHCRWCCSTTSRTRTSSTLSTPRNCASASLTAYLRCTREMRPMSFLSSRKLVVLSTRTSCRECLQVQSQFDLHMTF